MTTIEERLKEIETERQELLDAVRMTGMRLAELNTQRQNIIMSQED